MTKQIVFQGLLMVLVTVSGIIFFSCSGGNIQRSAKDRAHLKQPLFDPISDPTPGGGNGPVGTVEDHVNKQPNPDQVSVGFIRGYFSGKEYTTYTKPIANPRLVLKDANSNVIHSEPLPANFMSKGYTVSLDGNDLKAAKSVDICGDGSLSKQNDKMAQGDNVLLIGSGSTDCLPTTALVGTPVAGMQVSKKRKVSFDTSNTAGSGSSNTNVVFRHCTGGGGGGGAGVPILDIPVPQQNNPGSGSGGGGGGGGQNCADQKFSSPLVLALNRKGRIQVSSLAHGVSFDINADGKAIKTAWPVAAPFVVYDRNANGKIDSGAELFGDSTPLASGKKAANGFDALKEFDSDGDQRITSKDANYSKLALWFDRFPRNGVTDARELVSLGHAGIEIETNAESVMDMDRHGNLTLFRSFALIQRGFTRKVRIADIYFVTE